MQYMKMIFLHEPPGIFLGKSSGCLRLRSGFCCCWAGVSYLLDFVICFLPGNKQVILSRCWFERYSDYLANSWWGFWPRFLADVTGRYSPARVVQQRPGIILAAAYLSPEIPLNSEEGTPAKSVILASSCFNHDKLNWELIASNLISLDLGRNHSESELNRGFLTASGGKSGRDLLSNSLYLSVLLWGVCYALHFLSSVNGVQPDSSLV